MNKNNDDPDTLQTMSRAMVQELRRASKDPTISTGRVSRAVVEALRQTGVADTVEKVKEHDKKLNGLFRQLTVSFSGLIKLDERIK